MFVHYSNPNVLVIPRQFGDTFMFVPGNNEIHSSIWEEIQKIPSVQRRIKMGSLKVTNEAEAEDDESPLAALGAGASKEMVRETYDPVLLRKWKSLENRKTVIETIDMQLELADKRIAERQRKRPTEQDEE
jgi:hypothetical protein